MSPWQLSEKKPESSLSRKSRGVLAILQLGAGAVSLIVSPMAWPLFLIYMCLGIAAGLVMSLGEFPALVALVAVLFGLEAGPPWLGKVVPQWHATWWQPGVVTLTAIALVALTAIVRNFRVK